MKYSDVDAWRSPQKKTFETMEKLKFSRGSCVRQLYPDFWILDGSMRVLETAGHHITISYDIYNNNHHKRDVMCIYR